MGEKSGRLKEKIRCLFACGKPWHKKWWVRLIGVFLIIGLILIPFAINCAYMKGMTLDKPNTAFSASDLLSFYGAVLTFLGTTFLGIVAYRQNQIHNHKQIELDNANTLTPFLTINGVTASREDLEAAPFEISHYKVPGKRAIVTLKNIGQGLATGVTYKHWFGELRDPEDRQKNIDLNIGETFQMQIFVGEKYVDEIKKLDIKYQNILGFQYKQTLSCKLVREYEQVDEFDWEDNYFLYIYLMGIQQRIGMKEATTNDKT